MLFRVSCQACQISCLWTDDPKSFLESVCHRYRHCEAKLLDESHALSMRRKKAVGRVAAAQMMSPRAAVGARSRSAPAK